MALTSERVKKINPNLPIPNAPVQTVRQAVRNLSGTKEDIQKTIEGSPLDAHLKNLLLDRLEGVQASGARVDLHESDHPDGQGGFNLHVTVAAKAIGQNPKAVFTR